MSYILNIGLAREGQPNLAALEVRDAVYTAGFTGVTSAILQSDSEPTVVIQCTGGYSYVPVAVRVAQLSEVLGQDCIACYNTRTNEGFLAGPRADAWGEFNPEFFFLVGGARLSEVVV